VGRSRSGEFIFLGASSSTTSEFWTIPASDPNAAPKSMLGRKDGLLYGADHRPGEFYILTNDTGSNYRLVSVPQDKVDPANFKTLIAHNKDVYLENVDAFKDHLVVSLRSGGNPAIGVIDLAQPVSPVKGADVKLVPMPEEVYSTTGGHNEVFDATSYRFGYESLITPSTVFTVDFGTLALTTLKRSEIPGGYDPSLYDTKRMFVDTPYGPRIPISMVYRRDKGPFPRPALLEAYGAYGIPNWIYFDSNRISLLDRGFVCIFAHVRGGGEMGKPWHEAGRLMQKKNTFTDLIEVMEFLHNQKITTPQQLAITGGSAGGLTVGATINMRPELMKAALLGVPFVDMMNTMLDDSLPLTTQEYTEWGNPNEKPAFDYMLSYSPYDNLRWLKYPATMLYTSLNDSQVMYWEPAKFAQRMRRVKQGTNPVLLWTTMSGGHGGSSGRFDQMRETAMQYAFVIQQVAPEPAK
jgi:oligopeptidase B